jgi:NDP-sugar pyrophosphorylase family protein
MKAMILAAGLGTRLRPLTNDRPKALVTLGGRTLLEWALRRLRAAGATEIIVNTHHFADLVEAEIGRLREKLGLAIAVSREPELLDTGGGLKRAAWFFSGSEEPFLLHNVDVASGIDLGQMLRAHREQKNLATLAVSERVSSRKLLFTAAGQLVGRRTTRQGETTDELASAAVSVALTPLAFGGLHVLSPDLFPLLTEEGAFSIIPAYLRLAGEGHPIAAFRSTGAYWRDLGRPESLHQAEQDLRDGLLKLD